MSSCAQSPSGGFDARTATARSRCSAAFPSVAVAVFPRPISYPLCLSSHQVAIITGGSSGIGLEITRQLGALCRHVHYAALCRHVHYAN